MRAAVAHDQLEAVCGQAARRRQRREASATLCAGGKQSRRIEDSYAASAARAVGDEDLTVGDGEASRP